MSKPQPGWTVDQWLAYWREHPQTFEVHAACYPGEAGLEYVAAAYEEIGAQADSDADPDNEALYHYWERAAYGEAFWALKKHEQEQYNWPPRAAV